MIEEIAKQAKKASSSIARATTDQKNQVLLEIIRGLKKHEKEILEANLKDIAIAQKESLNESLIDRLSLQGRIDGLIRDIHQIVMLPDPIGEIFEEKTIGNLKITKSRTALGVLGVIYESRPNVTIDIACLSIKSGNCAILRGGKETLNSNQVLMDVIQSALMNQALPAEVIQLVKSKDRGDVYNLLQLHDYIDLIIPRGGAELHRFCRENSKIPVITGGIGICHLFVDESADLIRSIPVIINAKTQRPTVCNALDTLLVHEKVAQQFIPEIIRQLQEKGVSFRLDQKAAAIMNSKEIAHANDWDTEWLSLVLGIKVVSNLEEAIQHITLHSTGHSDGILSENPKNVEQFLKEVDSAAVYVNASTRFTDGSQLGLGAEVAISTQKIHARGPMGLHELTSYKWIIHGTYSIR